MFDLPQLEGGKKKKMKQHIEKRYALILLDSNFHSSDTHDSEVFLNHGNLVGKSKNKNKIQYQNIPSTWSITIPIK